MGFGKLKPLSSWNNPRPWRVVKASLNRPLLLREYYQSIFQAASLPESIPAALQAGEIDVAAFASSSAVRGLLNLLGDNAKQLLEPVKVASIGPMTSDALREAGLAIDAETDQPGIPGLVDAILDSFVK